MNNFPLEEYEPDLVDFQSDVIDVDQMILRQNGVRLALTGLTLKNYRSYEEFYICTGCGKVYWQGTHWKRQVARNYRGKEMKTEEIDEESVSSPDSDDSDDEIFYDAQEVL